MKKGKTIKRKEPEKGGMLGREGKTELDRSHEKVFPNSESRLKTSFWLREVIHVRKTSKKTKQQEGSGKEMRCHGKQRSMKKEESKKPKKKNKLLCVIEEMGFYEGLSIKAKAPSPGGETCQTRVSKSCLSVERSLSQKGPDWPDPLNQGDQTEKEEQ